MLSTQSHEVVMLACPTAVFRHTACVWTTVPAFGGWNWDCSVAQIMTISCASDNSTTSLVVEKSGCYDIVMLQDNRQSCIHGALQAVEFRKQVLIRGAV